MVLPKTERKKATDDQLLNTLHCGKEWKGFEMAEFTTIETQEQLDAIIGERLKREKEKHSETSAGLLNEIEQLKANNETLSKTIKEYETKYAGIDEQIDSMRSQINTYKTDLVKTEIAKKVGIPYELRDRLRGTTEEEIQADAEALAKMLPKTPAPMRTNEPIEGSGNPIDSALKSMLGNK